MSTIELALPRPQPMPESGPAIPFVIPWAKSARSPDTRLVSLTDEYAAMQVRIADLSNVTFLRGRSGLVIAHPFTNTETTRAALMLYRNRCGAAPVSAIIYADGQVEEDERIRIPDAAAGLPWRTEVDGVAATVFTMRADDRPASLIWLPGPRIVIADEAITHRLHELEVVRGGSVAEAGTWSRALDALLRECATTVEVIVTQHHWPIWGNSRVVAHLAAQRDVLQRLDEDA